MPVRSGRAQPRLALAMAAVAFAGCAGTVVTPDQTGVEGPPPEATQRVVPSETATEPAAQTPGPDSPGPTLHPAWLPPDARLSVEGGDPVTGDLGSFTWLNGGSDSPWLPGEPITVGVGEMLQLALEPPIAVQQWTAAREPWPLPVGASTPAQAGRGDLGDALSFAAPPPGIWSVQVSVRFTGNRGSATYYWRVEVR